MRLHQGHFSVHKELKRRKKKRKEEVQTKVHENVLGKPGLGNSRGVRGKKRVISVHPRQKYKETIRKKKEPRPQKLLIKSIGGVGGQRSLVGKEPGGQGKYFKRGKKRKKKGGKMTVLQGSEKSA